MNYSIIYHRTNAINQFFNTINNDKNASTYLADEAIN